MDSYDNDTILLLLDDDLFWEEAEPCINTINPTQYGPTPLGTVQSERYQKH